MTTGCLGLRPRSSAACPGLGPRQPRGMPLFSAEAFSAGRPFKRCMLELSHGGTACSPVLNALWDGHQLAQVESHADDRDEEG